VSSRRDLAAGLSVDDLSVTARLVGRDPTVGLAADSIVRLAA
jgi:hypothetical protein